MEPTSHYIVQCPNDGERADVLKHPSLGFEVSCPKCNRVEYGRDLIRTLECFKADAVTPRR